MPAPSSTRSARRSAPRPGPEPKNSRPTPFSSASGNASAGSSGRRSARRSTPRASSCTRASAGPFCRRTPSRRSSPSATATRPWPSTSRPAGATSRDRHVEGLLRELTGAEAATVANNNAAATVLILNTLARGKEVIVSRGQLVEIGGSFRMPDVMATSGAVLREVGTTNKTHLRDYEEAIGEATGAILRVHHSNYRIVGFAEEPAIEALAELGRARRVPVIDDLGSGALVDLARIRPRARAPGPGQRPGRGRRRLLQRRQAHRRAAVRPHRRPRGMGGEDQEEPAGPRLPLRQADPGRARGDAQALPLARTRSRARHPVYRMLAP